MSGIVGAFHFDRSHRIDPAFFQRGYDAIGRAGADALSVAERGGILSVSGAALGQFRPAAEAPTAPLWDAEERLAVVFDGELAGVDELRAVLEREGHRLRHGSHPELVLAAYRHWGPACIEHVQGVFAFAVLDRRAHSVMLARDRVGVRPLFFFRDAGRLLFASTVAGILPQGSVPRVLDPEAASDFMALGFVPGPRTVLRNIQALGPGQALYADREGARTWTYWQPEFRPDRRRNLEQHAQAILTNIDRTTRPASGAVLALSGGLGAAVVAAALAQQNAEPLRTVTVEWGGPSEHGEAEVTARHLGAIHSVAQAKDLSTLWTKLTSDAEPPVDAPALVWLALAHGLADHATTAWSGAGTDIVFATAARYRAAVRAETVRGQLTDRLGSGLGHGRMGRLGRRLTGGGLEARFVGGLTDRVHRGWYTQDFLRGLRGYDISARVAAEAPADPMLDPLTRLQTLDLRITLPSAILAHAERSERHSGIRWRHPLVDSRLVDYVGALVARYRLDVDHDRVVLQRAARRRLPPQVVQRRSSGIAPLTVARTAEWLRGPLSDVLQAELFRRESTGLFEIGALRNAWYRLQLGSDRPATALWRVAALEAWAQRV